MYPLVKPFVVAGALMALLAGLLFGSLLAGFAFVILFFACGLVWRADEPPVLPFALAFQWVFIMAGYLYTRAGGEMDPEALMGNIDLAIFLSLIGLLCLAVGLRLGLALLGRRLLQRPTHAKQSEPFLDVRALFWATVITYSVSWAVAISPMDIFFNAAQILYSVLSFREVLLCLLWLTILRRREGYFYGWIAFLIALVPRFISLQSTFKELIFMVLVVVLSEFKPWVPTETQRTLNRRLISMLAAATALLVMAGVIWEGAIKPVWRNLEIEGSPTEKLDAFVQVTAITTRDLKPEDGFKALVSRVSSITQFALVLERVPDFVPHEGGRLTKRAIMHVLVPRFLYPEKEILETDSLLAEEYAGLKIGEDTSVGIGYMAEFYVDYGAWGMFPALLVLGTFLGLAYGLIFRWSPSYLIACAVVIVPFIGNFITFEATLPKLIGGFIVNVVITLILARGIPRLLGRTRNILGVADTVVPQRP